MQILGTKKLILYYCNIPDSILIYELEDEWKF